MWKTPTQISKGIRILLEIEIKPLDVHNFIQGHEKNWANSKVYCKQCNVDVKIHPRCPFCTKLIHGDEICCVPILKHL
jgi:hypothetical protein